MTRSGRIQTQNKNSLYSNSLVFARGSYSIDLELGYRESLSMTIIFVMCIPSLKYFTMEMRANQLMGIRVTIIPTHFRPSL